MEITRLLMSMCFLLSCGCTMINKLPSNICNVQVVDRLTNKPLENASVFSGSYNHLSLKFQGSTNDSGIFSCPANRINREETIGNIDWGNCETPFLWVRKEGYADKRMDHYVSTSSQPISCELQKAIPVQGNVVEDDGSPCANVPLLLVGFDDGWPIQFQTKTDDQGEFRWLNSPSSSVRVYYGFSSHSKEVQRYDITDPQRPARIVYAKQEVAVLPSVIAWYVAHNGSIVIYPREISSPFLSQKSDDPEDEVVAYTFDSGKSVAIYNLTRRTWQWEQRLGPELGTSFVTK